MTDEELFSLNEAGLIPGPGESEKEFLDRVQRAKKNLGQIEQIPPAHWDWVRESLAQMFDVKPLYISAFYSNRSLALWQGAATWIEGRFFHSIQLREGLRKGTYLRLYSREEVLAHESIHAARSGFDEKRFEELFAYMTSEKKWRRVLGPILQRPWEAWPFILFLAIGVFSPAGYLMASLWTGLGFIRLIGQHRTLNRAANRILEWTQSSKRTRAILFRLTDREIDQFAKGQNIKEYAEAQTCLRWRVIRKYLKENYGKKNDCD